MSGEARLVEKHVPSSNDIFECLGIAASIGVAAAPGLPVKCPYHLLSVSASGHTENVMRIASALPVNVTPHR
ncbi:MAG TPA: hypothetical protein VFR23_19565 [Jiangellaceae bacterium]|nr:hypothetical protein [Jiangellaceae bacterium]